MDRFLLEDLPRLEVIVFTCLLLMSLPALAEPEMIPMEVFQPPAAVDAPTNVALTLKDGGEFRMEEHRGSPVLLTFWASWCSPCRRELPALGAFAKQNPGLYILAVNVDRTRPDAEQFLSRIRFDLPVAFDPDSRFLGAYGVTSMPTMMLYDSSGQLAWQHTGYSEEKGFEELTAALRGVR